MGANILGRYSDGAFLFLLAGAVLVGGQHPSLAQDEPKPEAKEEAKPAKTEPDSPYLEMAIDETLDSGSHLRQMERILDGRSMKLAGNEPKFDAYFLTYFLPRITTLESLDELPDYRNEMKELFARAKDQPDAVERLNQLAARMMFAIAEGAYHARARRGGADVYVIRDSSGRNVLRVYQLDHREVPNPKSTVVKFEEPARQFHPAVRYNAMLILGELNDKPGDTKEGVLPQPRLKIIPMLSTLLRGGRWPSPKDGKLDEGRIVPDFVRVAALNGLKRHAELLDLTEGTKGLIADAMLQTLNQSPPPGRNAAGDLWIRRQAVDVLAALGTTGTEHSTVKALDKVVADRSAPLKLRCAAADALGRLEYSNAPAGGVAPLLEHLGGLAVDATSAELERSARSASARISRSQLLDWLGSVQTAIVGPPSPGPAATAAGTAGLYSAATPAEQQSIKILAQKIASMRGLLANESMAGSVIRSRFEQMMPEIETIVAIGNSKPESFNDPDEGGATEPGDTKPGEDADAKEKPTPEEKPAADDKPVEDPFDL